MSVTTDRKDLSDRIDQLRSGYEGHAQSLRGRNSTYLRLFSPEYNASLKEHDQWGTPILAKDKGKSRSSYNIVRAVVELWTALEAVPLPSTAWVDQFIPPMIPELDEELHKRMEQVRRAQKLVATQVTTMREQTLAKLHRTGDLDTHYYRSILRKNLFGHSWLKVIVDEDRERFRYKSQIDPSTTYPVFSAWDEEELAAMLVVTRKQARVMSEMYPDAVKTESDGSASAEGWYQPTATTYNDMSRNFVWVEDYWVLDRDWEAEVVEGDEPVESRVINAVRVNGKIVEVREYPGWRNLPFFYNHNDNLRDHTGFSDAGAVAPIQDGINRFMSSQDDVISGSSRPKWVHRADGGAMSEVKLTDDGVINLNLDEELAQLRAVIDMYPTQIHGQQLMELLARSTGLNDSVFGRIVASQNSGRALAWAHRSVSARLAPRLREDRAMLTRLNSFELDIMELYDWDSARELYNGNRDFEIKFPNQEPRDFMEVVTVAINKHNAGGLDKKGMMEEWGEESPDEMQERVRTDYTDVVLFPDKAQAYQLIEYQQFKMQAEMLQMEQMRTEMATRAEALRNTPANGAPGGMNPAAAQQAGVQAAQQAAPTTPPGSGPQPATQAGQQSNATATTLVRNGQTLGNQILVRNEL